MNRVDWRRGEGWETAHPDSPLYFSSLAHLTKYPWWNWRRKSVKLPSFRRLLNLFIMSFSFFLLINMMERLGGAVVLGKELKLRRVSTSASLLISSGSSSLFWRVIRPVCGWTLKRQMTTSVQWDAPCNTDWSIQVYINQRGRFSFKLC